MVDVVNVHAQRYTSDGGTHHHIDDEIRKLEQQRACCLPHCWCLKALGHAKRGMLSAMRGMLCVSVFVCVRPERV